MSYAACLFAGMTSLRTIYTINMDVQQTSRPIEKSIDFCDTFEAFCNVYKSPNAHWDNGNLPPPLEYPAVYAGDFNSHHEDWGYKTANKDSSTLAVLDK